MQIQPVTVWSNGQEQQADGFILTTSFDNLSTAALFSYSLVKTSNSVNEGVNLQNGTLNIDGQDYQDWDTSTNANDWIYNWAATKLNLVLIPSEVTA
jgi:hypothetical protein